MNNLKEIQKNLLDFSNIYGELPNSLSELKKFAIARGSKVSSFDAWGVKLSYIKLDNDQWFIRSFGPDKDANTFQQGDDIVINSLKYKATLGVTYSFHTQPHAFPFALNLGAFSPDQKWFARIFIDPFRKTKQLIVINKKKPNMVFVAPHDSVTSFYWLKSSEEIIFSGSGGSRYGDGLFVWNLKQRSLKNVLAKIGSSHPVRLGRLNTWFIYLAGVVNEDRSSTAYFFLSPRESKPLKLEEFFSEDNLWEASIPGEQLSRTQLSAQTKTSEITLRNPPSGTFLDAVKSLQLHGLALSDSIDCSSGSAEQKRICHAPEFGGPAKDLETLQEVTESLIETPAFTYLLWQLVQSYSLASKSNQVSEIEAKTLKSYSLELARLLTQHYSAPPWLQHAAWNYWLDGVAPPN